jgi:hypothetical protein
MGGAVGDFPGGIGDSVGVRRASHLTCATSTVVLGGFISGFHWGRGEHM